MTPEEREKKEFNEIWNRVAKARQQFIIDHNVEIVNKKKALNSNQGKVSRCWGLLKRVVPTLIFLALVFYMLRGPIYRRMGWETNKFQSNSTLTDDISGEHNIPPRKQQEHVNYAKRMTPEEIEKAELEMLKEKEGANQEEYQYEDKEEDYVDPRDEL